MKKRWLPVLIAALLVGLVLAGNAASLPFADVSKGAWYYDAVQYVYENDLFSGTSGTTFEPQTPMTRGMLVSVLWRLDGKPAVPAENPFTDVAPRVWYTSGVLWAASEDIVSGMGGGIFAPNENITREQMASIMMRYAAYKGIAVEARADLSGYADSGKISKWAKQSVSWANAVGELVFHHISKFDNIYENLCRKNTRFRIRLHCFQKSFYFGLLKEADYFVT